MIKKIITHTFFLALYLFSTSFLSAQNKKEKIELLQLKVDSLIQVVTNERKVNTQKVKDLNFSISELENQNSSLEKELEKANKELQIKNKELSDRATETANLYDQLQGKSDSLSVLIIELKRLKIKLSSYASLVKVDGKLVEWKTVKIGSQIWMTENLNISTFRNGDKIFEAKTLAEWQEANDNKQPAWCYYNNDPANGVKYGKLYNWYAVNDKRGLAPEGWRVPTDRDWEILETALGGYFEAGNKMMMTTGEADLHKGTNSSGFSAIHAGYRVKAFEGINEETKFWAKKTSRDFNAVELRYSRTYTDGVNGTIKEIGFSHGNYMPIVGFSVRLINDFGLE
jgi:uncharacterized protein (TIGR02145 family)